MAPLRTMAAPPAPTHPLRTPHHNQHTALLLVVALLCSPSAIVAQPHLDLLRELDSVVAEAEAKADRAWWLQLSDNLSGTLCLRGLHYLRPPTDSNPNLPDFVERDRRFGEARLELGTWAGTDAWRVDAHGWIEGGNQKGTWQGVSRWFQDGGRHRRHLEINELTLKLLAADTDITLGKAPLRNGMGTLFSPADRYRPFDLNDPLDVRDLGIWQLRVDRHWSETIVTFALLPVYQGMKVPHEQSRWYGAGIDYNFRYEDLVPSNLVGASGPFTALVPQSAFGWLATEGLNVAGLPFDEASGRIRIREENPDRAWRHLGGLVKVKTYHRGFDLFASASHSYGPYYALRAERKGGRIELSKTPVQYATIATGFSTARGKWEVHGEGVYNHAYAGKDDNYVNGMVGSTRIFDDLARTMWLQQIRLTLAYAHEWETRKQRASDYIVGSRETRLGRSDVLMRLELKASEDLYVRLLAHRELKRGGHFHRIETAYRLREGLTLSVRLECFGGARKSYHGLWRRNDRLIAMLEYAF